MKNEFLIKSQNNKELLSKNELEKFIIINNEKSKQIQQQIKLLNILKAAEKIIIQKKQELKYLALITLKAEIQWFDLLKDHKLKNNLSYRDLNIPDRKISILNALKLKENDLEKIIDDLIRQDKMPSSSNIYETFKTNKGYKRQYKKIKINVSYKPRIIKWMIETLENYLSKSETSQIKELYMEAIIILKKITGEIK